MKDAKSLLLLLVSFLLVVVSFILIWTWGYRYYTSRDEYKVNARVVLTDSVATVNRIRDSLQHVYDETIRKLDAQLDSSLVNSDSLKSQLDAKLAEFFRLSSEIRALLNSRNVAANFGTAKRKLGELQNKASVSVSFGCARSSFGCDGSYDGRASRWPASPAERGCQAG